MQAAVEHTRKFIEEHLVSGEPKAGNEIAIRIDQTLDAEISGSSVTNLPNRAGPTPTGLQPCLETLTGEAAQGQVGVGALGVTQDRRTGKMKVLAQGELVECHVCGEPVRSAGHHVRGWPGPAV